MKTTSGSGIHFSNSLEMEAWQRGYDVWCIVPRDKEYMVAECITTRDIKTGAILVLCETSVGVVSGCIRIGQPRTVKNLPVLGDEYVGR